MIGDQASLTRTASEEEILRYLLAEKREKTAEMPD